MDLTQNGGVKNIRILIIGNGFDLAHNLPTRYLDFMDFIEIYILYEHDIDKEDLLETCSADGLSELQIDFIKCLRKLYIEKRDIFNEFADMINDNIWYIHFNTVKNKLLKEGKDCWIDFESEISKIVEIFDEINQKMLSDEKNGGYGIRLNDYELDILNMVFIEDEPENTEDLSIIKERMIYDLNRLTRALEIYLSAFINNVEIKNRIKEIEELQVDKVLSFNYTNTYERVYGSGLEGEIEYDYIHGEANLEHNIDTCNMVLGIDEYLEDEDKDKNIEFIQFKKFFQRIYKKTGCKYVDWIDQDSELSIFKDYENVIYIWGHSLDITDNDILSEIISHNSSRIKIYYLNKQVMGKQITNLVKMIGQDTLVSSVYGDSAKIEFIEQKK